MDDLYYEAIENLERAIRQCNLALAAKHHLEYKAIESILSHSNISFGDDAYISAVGYDWRKCKVIEISGGRLYPKYISLEHNNIYLLVQFYTAKNRLTKRRNGIALGEIKGIITVDEYESQQAEIRRQRREAKAMERQRARQEAKEQLIPKSFESDTTRVLNDLPSDTKQRIAVPFNTNQVIITERFSPTHAGKTLSAITKPVLHGIIQGTINVPGFTPQDIEALKTSMAKHKMLR